MSLKTIYISGITGFVGVNLKDYLKDNYLIEGLSRSNTKFNYQSIEASDLNNSKAFIHLAGKAHDLKKTADSNSYFEVNTELTKQIYNKFLASNCEIFIYMSSVKAIADQVADVLTETTKPEPKTAYGKSKLEAEKFILSNLPKNKKQKVYILRPCMIHGPGNKGNLNLLYSFVKKEIPFPLGAFKNKRSFLSVDNLSFIISKILKDNLEEGIYNVADSGTLSINQLVETIGKADNKKATILKLPKSIINILAKFGDVFSFLPLNSEKLQKLTENYIVDNSKLVKNLDQELPMSITEGIIKTIKHFN